MERIRIRQYIPKFSRDPAGILFFKDGLIYRCIRDIYKADYEFLMRSGLYQKLVELGLLVSHQEVDVEYPGAAVAYKVIKPEQSHFISYPYEWCFSQLKDAALLTLRIQKIALEFGMSLKDCSAYNVQFIKGRPVLIDTLSFEKYEEGPPWVAYRQFCQHFLAPLAVMSYTDTRMNQLFRIYMDGIPLDLANSLLPLRTYFKFSLLSHVRFHAKIQQHVRSTARKRRFPRISRFSFLGLIDNLENAVRGLKWCKGSSSWGNYYNNSYYSTQAFCHKQEIVGEFLNQLNPQIVWDLGANTGIFSRIASKQGSEVISFDHDFNVVEENYRLCVRDKEPNILPLYTDFINPGTALGWGNSETASLVERGPADTALVLALLHHFAIENNIPLYHIASFFNDICNSLVIEFVSKDDSQVQAMLANRKDIFPYYTQENFEKVFKKFFSIVSVVKIKDSQRILYLMKKGNL